MRISIDRFSLIALRTYPFEVTVNYVVGVKNLESVTDVEELGLV